MRKRCCEDPLNEAHVSGVERLAGTRYPAWGRSARSLHRSDQRRPGDRRAPRAALPHGSLVRRKGDATRPSAALVDAARGGRAQSRSRLVGEKAQQWAEYGQVLLRRADVAAPNLARDLRVEAAEGVGLAPRQPERSPRAVCLRAGGRSGAREGEPFAGGLARGGRRRRGRPLRASKSRQDAARRRTTPSAVRSGRSVRRRSRQARRGREDVSRGAGGKSALHRRAARSGSRADAPPVATASSWTCCARRSTWR